MEVGDTVFVEQGWEDEAGFYHDEVAEVTAIDGDLMTLKFERDEITEWLRGCEYRVQDYEPLSLMIGLKSIIPNHL